MNTTGKKFGGRQKGTPNKIRNPKQRLLQKDEVPRRQTCGTKNTLFQTMTKNSNVTKSDNPYSTQMPEYEKITKIMRSQQYFLPSNDNHEKMIFPRKDY